MKKQILMFLLFLILAGRALADDEANTQSSSFDSDGVKIVYFEAGKGDPVILVHGLYSSAKINWMMPGIFQRLAEHHHVIALDLRGHGESDKPTAEDAYGQPMVDDIVRLMDHLKIPRAQIAGYSLGGIIAMKFIVDHPDRVVAGSLGGIAWLRDGSFEQRLFELMKGASKSETPPACAHGIARLAVTEDQVKAIKVPTKVFVGDRDPCKRMYVDPLHRVRPDIPISIIDGAGHMTCIVKDQFKTELVDWIDKNSD